MIGEEEAARLARRWVSRGRPDGEQSDVHLHAFDGGWVAWPVDGSSADPTLPPAPDGGPRAVVDARSGEVTEWPSLPAAVIAARYRVERGLAPAPTAPAYRPGNAAELAMLQARHGGDPVGYVRALASVELLVPFVTRLGRLPRTVLAEHDGRPHQLVFTSPEAARIAFAAAGSRSRTWHFVRTTVTNLLDGWARPGTGLTVDPGTPMEASMSPETLHGWLSQAGIRARHPGQEPASPANPNAAGAAPDPQPIAVFSQTPLQAGRGVFLLLAGAVLMLLALAIGSRVEALVIMAFALVCLGIGGASIGTLVREARYASRLKRTRP